MFAHASFVETFGLTDVQFVASGTLYGINEIHAVTGDVETCSVSTETVRVLHDTRSVESGAVSAISVGAEFARRFPSFVWWNFGTN